MKLANRLLGRSDWRKSIEDKEVEVVFRGRCGVLRAAQAESWLENAGIASKSNVD